MIAREKKVDIDYLHRQDLATGRYPAKQVVIGAEPNGMPRIPNSSKC